MRFGFVVLHYLCTGMTREAVDLLLERFGTQDIEIAVVDNASPNGSGAVLESAYSGDPRVKVILNGSNMGFARGNNAGYSYFREKGGFDFVVVMNNDVLIRQEDFLRRIEEIYSRTPFAVLGPDILAVKTGVHQNPAHEKVFSREEVLSLRSRLEKRDSAFLRRWLGWKLKLMLGIARETSPASSLLWERQCSGVVLHGACYIFSRDFILRREHAFNPATFLYMEEDILAKECHDAGLTMLYCPEIRVEHLEDVTTDVMWRSSYQKAKNKNRQMLLSCRILEELYG